MCGGSIISKSWILTSARCTNYAPDNLHKIRVGTDLRKQGGRVYKVDRVIRHENFSYVNELPINNVALVHLTEPITLDRTTDVTLMFDHGDKLAAGEVANVTGFGYVRGNVFPGSLKSVEVPVIDSDLCNRVYKDRYGGIPEGVICAGYKGSDEGHPCNGDAGGPLVVAGRLAGFVSFIVSCSGEPHYPVLYTDVAYYRQWIDGHIGRE